MSADGQCNLGMGEDKLKISSEENQNECSRGCCAVQSPTSSEMGNEEELSFF